MTVVPVVPSTVNDSAITPFNRPITVNVLANDKPGDPSAPLVAGSVLLKDGSAYGKSLDQAGGGPVRRQRGRVDHVHAGEGLPGRDRARAVQGE